MNCARLIKPDQHATNGIVHVVDRVITAISNDVQTILDVDDDLETLRVRASVAWQCQGLLICGDVSLQSWTYHLLFVL